MDLMGTQVKFPKFLTFDEKEKLFTLKTTADIAEGLYQVGLRLGYKEFEEFIVTCTKVVAVVYEPIFKGEEIEDQTIIVGQDWKITLPTYTDGFGLECKVTTLELGKSLDFLKYDAITGSIKLKIDSKELEQYLGAYQC